MIYGEIDLVRAVLRFLNRLGPGQDISAEDSDTITFVLPAIYADLDARDVIGINEDDIDPAAFMWLREYVGGVCGPDLGVVSIDGRSMQQVRDNAQTMLKTINRSPLNGKTPMFEGGIPGVLRRVTGVT